MSAKTDRELLTRARRGDGAAFAELFAAYEPDVARVCRRMLGGIADDADDASSEVFLRARRGLSSVDPERPFKPWLLSVTSHHCVDLLRRRSRESRIFDPRDADEVGATDPSPSPLSSLVWAERREELIAAIDGLPPRHRVPLMLRYFAELDYKAIGEVLDVSPAAVSNCLYRARRALRDALSEDQG